MTFRLQQGDLYRPISKTAARNIEARPNVVVLWPPYEPKWLFNDRRRECRLQGEEPMVVPTPGVLHRPAAPEAPGELDCGTIAHHWVPRVRVPLTGIRVLEPGSFIAGPFVGSCLATTAPKLSKSSHPQSGGKCIVTPTATVIVARYSLKQTLRGDQFTV